MFTRLRSVVMAMTLVAALVVAAPSPASASPPRTEGARTAAHDLTVSAKRLKYLVNHRKWRKARRYATVEVLRYFRGQKWVLSTCYRTKRYNDPDNYYSGSRPRACNYYGKLAGGYGLGFKKVAPHRWRAVDIQELLD